MARLIGSLLFVWIMVLNAYGQNDQQRHHFEIGEKQFLLDGKNLQIISGEMHYARIPRPYWRDRLKKAKAMGLNAICTYMFWNAHEPKPGQFDFSDNLDIREFCRIAQEEGLWVIIRPGPYTCAEWDLGGLPAWLLKKRGVVLRSSDPNYMPPTLKFLKRAVQEFKPNLITHGGNVLMVQVENEYGVYADDKIYITAIKNTLLEAGVDVPLFHCDWAGKNYYDKAHIDGVMPSINFGGDAQKNFEIFEQYAPNAPRFNSEFWTGWFDYWGGKHEVHSVEEKLADFKWMVDNGVSVNLYMFHGGTSNGFFPGANGSNTYFTPYITSYDYDALLDESGEPTEKYFAFQKVILEKYPDLQLPSLPSPLKKISIPEISLKPYASLMANLPNGKFFNEPKTMEELDQMSGLILYSHTFEGARKGNLEIKRVMDRAMVYVDGELLGTLDRRLNQSKLPLNVGPGEHELEILVEHQARVNFGKAIDHERKGITEGVFINGEALKGWTHFSLPLDNTKGLKAAEIQEGYPAFYRSTFEISELGDTYLDTRNLDKGLLWINGKLIGRYWFIGPQQTLFVSGCWLKQGKNDLQVLEMGKPKGLTVTGLTQQVWETKVDSSLMVSKAGEKLMLDTKAAAYEGVLNDKEGWQVLELDKSLTGRYVLFETVSAYDGSPFASLAELRFLDEKGNEIPREEYTIRYADSEEFGEENGLATLLIDNQPTTFWHSQWSKDKPNHPHQIEIDLAARRTITAIRYLPRMKNTNGRIKDFRLYIADAPFAKNPAP
ncbi:beta-galactosidase [Olivibacter sp. XZL3]|uniref:beta-galactosidase n=1 Tax=Olivibacter sp. XZL3 TaxID=1735116 RepID=UPI001066B688|nr:beta-galactosidase [Olivibacter sp. XZL3]